MLNPTGGRAGAPIAQDGTAPLKVPRLIKPADIALDDPVNEALVLEVRESWRRSAEHHEVDPSSRHAPHILTAAEISASRGSLQGLIRAAQTELDQLYAIVQKLGYVVLLCDTQGVAIEHRGNDRQSELFRQWGVWLGGVWAEHIEGTNGIGTCIVEERPVTVHQAQHFRARHSPLSCSGAPIFDPEGALAAVLDVSSIDPRVSAGAHGLTLPLVAASARSIEEQLFRRRFQHEWILALAFLEEEGSACLLAVDEEYRVAGADRSARRVFGINTEHVARGLSVWTLFTRVSALLQRSEPGVDKTVILTTAGEARPLCALVSGPLPGLRARLDPLRAAFLMQPRIPLLADCRRTFAAERPRGGLSPGALRRVREHIESHLHGNIALPELAAQARLSVFHFAHAFRESMGVSPHRYLLQQRVKQAEQLLAHTELPLSSIATAVGFADQSHFARHFSRLVGMTPSAFRRAQG